MRKRILLYFVTALAAIAVASAGTTYALWNASVTPNLAAVNNGDLNLGVAQTFWEVRDAESNLIVNGEDLDSLDDLVNPCSDGATLHVTTKVMVTAKGYNLVPELTISWPSDQPKGTYELLNTSLQTVIETRPTGDDYTKQLQPSSIGYLLVQHYPLPRCAPFAASTSTSYAGFRLSVTHRTVT
ncbi:MAG: hypothetical protein LBR20_04795 [Propionibacteriaceae bacterium]|jgi:alternate signal-mediated exported protein|nr:hypothetical protein [Propionibacteriaceae bacterium]